ncbi:MAG: cytochrome c biogenesis protein ResB [Lachnospiraceae bacterium]|nr:cytochrome c biogenesis protein ResB [Lachnospiraceae bacterium]
MNKCFRFLRSMKFGILLLVLIMAVSFFGTVITQGQADEFYLANYQAAYLILALGLDHVYYTPYFLGLGVLLIGNLTLCSLVRFRSSFHGGESRLAAAQKIRTGRPATEEQLAKICAHLEKRRYHRRENEAVAVYYKNLIGGSGSFLVHLSLVLILIFGAVVIYTGKSQVYGVNYDAPLTLEDGTTVSLQDFVTTDSEGNVHYESTLTVTAPDGREITECASVNHPINFAGKKYFQDTYGYAVWLTIENTVNGAVDEIFLTEPAFLRTSQSGAGIYYMAVSTDYMQGPDGRLEVISDRVEEGKEAVFILSVMDGTDSGMTTGVVAQDQEVAVEDIIFTFRGIRPYPGIRIKETSRVLMGLLYASFGLMIAGLWFCFFQPPVCVTVGKTAGKGFYHIGGLRSPEGLENELQLCMEGDKCKT